MADQVGDAPATVGGAVPVRIEAATPALYSASLADKELRQSEIITNLTSYIVVGNNDGVSVNQVTNPYAIILAQDCDLLQDFNARAQAKARDLSGVLIYEAESAIEVRKQIKGSDIWKRIYQNKDERYHFLQEVPKGSDRLGEGLPALVVDFRRYFALTADEIYRQCAMSGDHGARRRCVIEVPYREHLQSRAAFYLQRVAIPVPHQYENPIGPATALLTGPAPHKK